MIWHWHCSRYHSKHLSNWWRLRPSLGTLAHVPLVFRPILQLPAILDIEDSAKFVKWLLWQWTQAHLQTLRMCPASWTVILSSSRLVPQPGHRHPLGLHLHSLQQQLQLCHGTAWVLLHQDIVHPVTIALFHLLSRTLHFLKVFLLVGAKESRSELQY